MRIERRKLRIPGALYGIALLVCVFGLGSRHFFTFSNAVNIVRQTSILAIISIASFLAIVNHKTDLSLGGIASLSGVLAVLLMRSGMGIVPSCVVALAVGAAFGAFNGILVAYSGIASFIITLGTMGISEGISLLLAGGGTLSVPLKEFRILGAGNVFFAPVSALIALALYLVAGTVMKHSAWGTYCYAIGGREEAAVAAGIKVSFVKIQVFAVNGLLAAFAGLVLVSRLGVANPSQGMGLEFDGITAAVMGGTSLAGGRGTIWGVLGGAFIMSILRNGLNMVGLPMALQILIVGVIMVCILSFDILRGSRSDA
jgi:ribose transport system permease protein